MTMDADAARKQLARAMVVIETLAMTAADSQELVTQYLPDDVPEEVRTLMSSAGRTASQEVGEVALEAAGAIRNAFKALGGSEQEVAEASYARLKAAIDGSHREYLTIGKPEGQA